MSPEARSVMARQAAIRRWIGVGSAHSALVHAAAGQESIESLLVSLPASRFKREGVPVPNDVFACADVRLYRLLEQTNGDVVHARYLAYLRQIESFANACAVARVLR